MNLLLNGKAVDALATIVHRDHAERVGKEWVRRLKDVVHKWVVILLLICRGCWEGVELVYLNLC